MSKNEISDVKLSSKLISKGIHGTKKMAHYPPLHLVLEGISLRKRSLTCGEMKTLMQPEDLSFDLLKAWVSEDDSMDDDVSVTCPGLQRTIKDDRHFQLAIHELLQSGLKFKFMFADSEPVSHETPATSLYSTLVSRLMSFRTCCDPRLHDYGQCLEA